MKGGELLPVPRGMVKGLFKGQPARGGGISELCSLYGRGKGKPQADRKNNNVHDESLDGHRYSSREKEIEKGYGFGLVAS
jgi:hypothetical protein